MRKKVAVLGGGTGISFLLKGLKDFPVDITAIICVSDNGSSTGKLRNEFNIPAIGDIRKVISNMSEIDEDIKSLMEYRFSTTSDLNNHALGNLVLVGLLNITGNLKDSINSLCKLLDVKHKVLPISEDNLVLMGKSVNGDIIEGEENITKAHTEYEKIFYKEKPHVTKEAIDAINDADLVILSMGSLYTSILPNIIIDEVKEVIAKTKAKVMYVCNAMTQPGETDNLGVSGHLKILNQYLEPNSIDVVVASNTKLTNYMVKKYRNEEYKDPVIIDKDEIDKLNIELIEANLLTTNDGTIKHDSLKLATLIFNYLMR